MTIVITILFGIVSSLIKFRVKGVMNKPISFFIIRGNSIEKANYKNIDLICWIFIDTYYIIMYYWNETNNRIIYWLNLLSLARVSYEIKK